ncbi:MAG: FAD-dependent oxidoreductase [Candidatus Latescibacterota bacterium]|nr:FAD-dependent oxidoreductase [Candidatus Latescibacterota bacterium]
MSLSQNVDVCVVGGGSGGIGAAVSTSRHGAETLLIEASPCLEGISTRAGVNNYEPVAGATGCESAIGFEPKTVYDEPSVPDEHKSVLNNASLCYRITPLKEDEQTEISDPPKGIDLDELNPVTSIRTYANGDRNMNPQRLMTGQEAFDLGNKAYKESLRRIKAQWYVLQTKYGFEFERWKMRWISPMLGIRETHRLVGEHVLTEHDVETPLEASTHDDIVAFADHALDFHGSRPSRQLVNGPYGIPFRCLLTKEFDNLLVACRGASFSSICASTCRLSRTMMVLGQAAGSAAALFGSSVKQFKAKNSRNTLRSDGIALDLADGYLDAMSDVQPKQETDW